MRKISVFIHVTVDGFFAGPHGEIDWFKVIKRDDEWEKYTHEQSARSGNTLIFGHTTYEMMKSYWPTPDAIRNDPGMARVVNNSPKIVFSKTLRNVEEGPNWKNIELFHEIKPQEIIKLKEEGGGDFTILGSGTIVQQFANLGLIDEYQLVVVPIILGAGKSLFKDVKKMNLKLLEAKAFKNGIVLLKYRPA
ncbi:MAG: dihydrofolate reductase family protein [Candidatus Methanoperedens sp.]|nr:dihydrofolate reductase family protein [Candidatus Methanoperedens sp.]